MRKHFAALSVLAVLLTGSCVLAQEQNLITNPSFEEFDQKALDKKDEKAFSGWIYHVWEGHCELRAGNVAHSGKTSAVMVGGVASKQRIWQEHELEAGRYRITAYIRGLNVGKGNWGTTTEFMFDGTDDGKGYFQLEKNGNFGWTKLTYVADIKAKHKVKGPSFGSWAPGYFWVDDVTLEKVGNDVPMTEKPVLDKEETPLAPPGKLDGTAVHCPDCGSRNMPGWKTCYACGWNMATRKPAPEELAGSPVKLITDFSNDNPFTQGDGSDKATLVPEHAAQGKKAIRLDQLWAVMRANQDWTGYDFLKADVYTDAKEGMALTIEASDTPSAGYFERVNYDTRIPPGPSTLLIPLKELYKGERAHPSGALNLSTIVKFVINIGDKPPAPLFISNIRLERDPGANQQGFDGLFALGFRVDSTMPLLEGFTPVYPPAQYSEIKGYGFNKDAKIEPGNSFFNDMMEPDPLYQSFIKIDAGEFVMDVPNGKYRVTMNINRPPGFWGEMQHYTKRTILAQGKPVITETMDDAVCRKIFFKHYGEEDLPSIDTFDRYVKSFDEKTFDVDVTDGQLRIGFQGDPDACCLSDMIVFPLSKLKEGEKFLKWVVDRRRFHFDTHSKRFVRPATGDGLNPTDADKKNGYITFTREIMKPVSYNDTPFKAELGKPVSADAFAGECAPMTLAVAPLQDLGKVTVTAGDLACQAGKIPASAIDVGYASYRLARVTPDGTVYTITPRYVMQLNSVDMPKDVTRRFWITTKVPADAKAGVYKGKLTLKPEKGRSSEVAVELRVRQGTLDALDIPAGPWGHIASYVDDATCLKKIREYGFTTFSSDPVVGYKGFKDGKPLLDFAAADKLMVTAKDLGFQAVMFYSTLVGGINAYEQDLNQMNNAGFKDYSEFIRSLYTEVQKHADEKGWITYYVNLGDEPMGDALRKSAENAEAYRKAFPDSKVPPFFTAATSLEDIAKDPEHVRLVKALPTPSLGGHNEEVIKMLHDAGGQWGFYNGGDRWTFGDYMYKAAKQFGMKYRIDWHWCAIGGDPYYPLDCREDEFTWCNSTPDGKLLPAVDFELRREGLGDYRRLLTLQRLAKEQAGTPAAAAAQKLIDERMDSFKLGQRDHDVLLGAGDWEQARARINDAIESLRK